MRLLPAVGGLLGLFTATSCALTPPAYPPVTRHATTPAGTGRISLLGLKDSGPAPLPVRGAPMSLPPSFATFSLPLIPAPAVPAEAAPPVAPVAPAVAVVKPEVVAAVVAAPAAEALAEAEAPAHEATVEELAAPLFLDGFEEGLTRWQVERSDGEPARTASPWQAIADAGPDENGIAALGRAPDAVARHTYLLKTTAPIDLSGAVHPHLHLVVKGSGVSFRAIWQSADPALPEETAIGRRFTLQKDWMVKDLDLAALPHRAGRLVLIARAAPGAEGAAIDHVSIEDAGL